MAKKATAQERKKHEKLPFPKGAALRSKPPEKKTSDPPEAGYYDLKLKAIDDLVTARPENSPPVSKKELRKYRSGPGISLSSGVKAILLKLWFAGMICYFFVWGLSLVNLNPWDLLLILSIVLGGATHFLTNNILRFIAKKEGEYDRWMMFPGTSLAFLPLDIVYAALLTVCTVMTYNGINLLISGGDAGVLGVEPVLFGVFVTAWDLAFIGIRQLLRRIIRDAKRKVSGL